MKRLLGLIRRIFKNREINGVLETNQEKVELRIDTPVLYPPSFTDDIINAVSGMIPLDKTRFIPLLKALRRMTPEERTQYVKALGGVNRDPNTGDLYPLPYQLDVSLNFKQAYDSWQQILYDSPYKSLKPTANNLISPIANEYYYLSLTNKLIDELFCRFVVTDRNGKPVPVPDYRKIPGGFSPFFPKGVGLAYAHCHGSSRAPYRILPAFIVDYVFPNITAFELYLGPYKQDVFFIESKYAQTFREKLRQILTPKY